MTNATRPEPPVGSQDLDAHHRPILEQLQSAAQRVIASGRYILGPEVEALEREVAQWLEIEGAVGMSSGTDALLALMMALEIGPGDEVVTTPFTFFATAGAIARVGARPIFADIDPGTLNLDEQAAIARIGPRTRAVMTVDLFGRLAPMEALRGACRNPGVLLLEDAAQSIGATRAGRGVGHLADAATLSFFPSKNLGGFGDGGMVVTRDAKLANRLRLVRGHGARPKYHHLLVGGNFRLDELQAALLRVKLPHLRGWNEARRRVAQLYRQSLAALPLGLPPDDPGCVWNQFVVRVPAAHRDPLCKHLANRGITTAVYYPEPLHLQPCFAAHGGKEGDLPESERACRETVALPIYPELSEAAVARVADATAAYFAGHPK